MQNQQMIDKNNVTAEFMKLCEYCQYPNKINNLMPCTRCKLNICHGCVTFINHKPFCNDCALKFLKDDALLIITKSGRDV